MKPLHIWPLVAACTSVQPYPHKPLPRKADWQVEVEGDPERPDQIRKELKAAQALHDEYMS